MWISRELTRSAADARAEEGTVYSAENGRLEAGAGGVSRSVLHCQPYGYCSALPQGERVMLIPSHGAPVALGTVTRESLPPGEIRLRSLGGAEILLKNDGSIVLNHTLTITKEGEIIHGTAS